MDTTTVLWGVKEGDEDWRETVLCTQPERFEAVKAMATRDGWGRFRVATINLTKPPDFTKAVSMSACECGSPKAPGESKCRGCAIGGFPR